MNDIEKEAIQKIKCQIERLENRIKYLESQKDALTHQVIGLESALELMAEAGQESLKKPFVRRICHEPHRI